MATRSTGKPETLPCQPLLRSPSGKQMFGNLHPWLLTRRSLAEPTHSVLLSTRSE
jgi:hypothetical protein